MNLSKIIILSFFLAFLFFLLGFFWIWNEAKHLIFDQLAAIDSRISFLFIHLDSQFKTILYSSISLGILPIIGGLNMILQKKIKKKSISFIRYILQIGYLTIAYILGIGVWFVFEYRHVWILASNIHEGTIEPSIQLEYGQLHFFIWGVLFSILAILIRHIPDIKKLLARPTILDSKVLDDFSS